MKTQYVPASFLRRFLAFFIDAFILSSFNAFIISINSNLLIVLSLAYFVLFDGSKFQGTLGKQFLGLRIVDKDGQRLSYPKALFRHILKYLGVAFFGIGYWGLIFKKEALVDRLSKTTVMKVSVV